MNLNATTTCCPKEALDAVVGDNKAVPHPLVSVLRAQATAAHPGADPVVDCHVIPAQPGVHSPWPTWVPTQLREAFSQTRGVTQPWRHQVDAWQVLRSGRHLALATATGSGKSLIAWVPVLAEILAPTSGRISQYYRPPTALYLSPTKALGNDQAQGLHQVLRHGLESVDVGVVDGDASPEERSWAQDHADIVFTNPDFVHYSLLPRHQRWVRMLRGLRYVFVDELHTYRGMVGAHVSLVLRRLLRLARRYGAHPQVVVASATATDPGPTVAKFLGVPLHEVGVIDQSSAPQGQRTVVLWDPPSIPEGDQSEQDGERKKSVFAEAADMLTTLVHHRSSTLVFTGSRAGAEAIAERTRVGLPHHLHSRVAAYRGGFLPEERRTIEQGLRSGTLLGVVSTSALEMGVDIPGLDAVIIAGWPGTWSSFWQQVGRTARAGTEGIAVFIASENPLDHYLLNHPQHVFSTPVEATVFDPSNPHIVAPHLCAAAAEAPLTEADLPGFGLSDSALVDELVARGLLRTRPQGWLWNYDRPESAHHLTDLRGDSGYGVSVVEQDTGRVVGTVDSSRADATVHPGAVYVHQGHSYTVVDSDDEVAVVKPTDHPLRTRAFTRTRVKILSEQDHHVWGDLRWCVGDIEVRSHVVSYQARRLPSMEVVGTYPLTMPERMLRTQGVWWTLPAQVLADNGVTQEELPGALHAAEHAMISLLGLVATCDRWDMGGLSTAVHESTLDPTVFVYDAFPGGAGFARRGFDAAHTWVQATLEAVEGCPCEQGCPRCIQSPKCGNGNSPLHKAGAITTLKVLMASFTTTAPPAR